MPGALSADDVAALVDLLEQCTVLICTKDGRSNGAGFFIDDRTLLTCAHVVKLGDEVDVTPYMRERRTGTVIQRRSVGEGDVALVTVEPDPADPSLQPAVLLDINVDRGSYHAAGYPKDEIFDAGLEVLRYDGSPRRSPSGELVGVQLAGRQITFGMSGGPVLNDRTGAVVAIVQSSKGTETVLGGGAIPIAFVAKEFDEVEELVKMPSVSTNRWRDAVPASAWADVGREWREQTPTFDIRVSGGLSKWLVALEPDGQPLQEVTVRDLSEEVAEVLFKWAQTRPVRGPSEVQLLGGLLGGALLPKGLAERLIGAQGDGELYVRLRVDPENELADVPWELATLRHDSIGLGAQRQIRFARVVRALGAATSFMPQRTIPVLAVVAQPDDFEYPAVFYDGKLVEWPNASRIRERLHRAVGNPPFEATVLENRTPAQLTVALAEGTAPRFDVLHYLGLARSGVHGLEFAMSDGEGGASWVSGQTFCGWIRDSGVRVVLIELMMTPYALDAEPVSLRKLVGDVRGRVQAVIATRSPVHFRQFQPFNEGFYACVANGETVEAAVQAGRFAVQANHPLGDYAGSAWFTGSTGERAGLRLYDAELASASVTVREPAEQAAHTEPQPSVTGGPRDAFQPTS